MKRGTSRPMRTSSPVPAFHIRPKSVEALVDHPIGRVLDLLEVDNDLPHRWREARS